MGSGSSDSKHRARLLLTDPWFWGLVVVGGVLIAALNEWLPEAWAIWAPGAVIAVVILVFSVLRGKRYGG